MCLEDKGIPADKGVPQEGLGGSSRQTQAPLPRDTRGSRAPVVPFPPFLLHWALAFLEWEALLLMMLLVQGSLCAKAAYG